MSTTQWETQTADWYSCSSIGPGLTHISDHGEDSIFLVEGEEHAILIDTGFGIGDLAACVRAITDKPLSVFNTHGHPDHCMGNYLFEQVRMHSDDLGMCNTPVRPDGVAFIRDRFLDGAFPEGFPLERWIAREPHPIPLDRRGYDFGEMDLEVIHTPGHTRGQVAYMLLPHRYLFIGDTIVHGKAWLHLDESTDLATYRQSVALIAGLCAEDVSVFCGHSAEPIPHHIIAALPEFLDRVQDGRVNGPEEHTFAGDGTAYLLEEPYGVIVKNSTQSEDRDAKRS
jgi:hydroxyacylglutathione hydrolase